MSASHLQRNATCVAILLSLLGLTAALAWSFAGHFASEAASSADSTRPIPFAMPFIGQLQYEPESIWPVNRVLTLMLTLACCLAYRHAGMAPRRLLAAALCFGLMTAMCALAGSIAGQPLPCISRILCAALVALTFFSVQREMIERLGVPATVLGTMLVLLAFLMALSVARPEESYLLAWPLPAALAAYGASHLLADTPQLRLALLLAGVLPAALLLGPRLLYSTGHGPSFMLTLVVLLGCASAFSAALLQRRAF